MMISLIFNEPISKRSRQFVFICFFIYVVMKDHFISYIDVYRVVMFVVDCQEESFTVLQFYLSFRHSFN